MKYFEKHPNMKWISVHTNDVMSVPGLVKTHWATFDSYFGRVDQVVNGTTFKILGKYEADNQKLWFTGSDSKEAEFRGMIEILACQL